MSNMFFQIMAQQQFNKLFILTSALQASKKVTSAAALKTKRKMFLYLIFSINPGPYVTFTLHLFNHTRQTQTHNPHCQFLSLCICFQFILFISHFALIPQPTEGYFPTVYMFSTNCADRACPQSVFLVSSAAFGVDPSAFGYTGHSFVEYTYMIFRQTATHCLVAIIMSRGANFPLLPFSMGLCCSQHCMRKARQTCLFFISGGKPCQGHQTIHRLHSSFPFFMQAEEGSKWSKCYGCSLAY